MEKKYYQGTSQIQTSFQSKNQIKSRPFMLKRIIYAMFLFSFLMIISFYFDLFQNYDFVSLLLGFFVCMIVQFKFLQYFFSYEMESMKIDQIGALRSKIKYLFGQLNPQYLDYKNKLKYYHHSLNKQDKLFSKQSSQIFQNTMQYFISKTINNHSQNIQKINRKWRIIISKLEIIKIFFTSLLQIHNNRAKIYNNNLGKLSRFTQSQFKIWKHLFENAQQSNFSQGKIRKSTSLTENSVSEDYLSFNGTFINDFKSQQNLQNFKKISNLQQINRSSNFFKIITWFQVIRAFQQKQKINSQKLKDIRRVVLEQLKKFYDHMVIRQNRKLTELNKLKSDCQSKSNQRTQISSLIQMQRKKMDQLLKIIVNKNRTTENHQQILKVELQMRMLKVECQNLQVKLSQCQDKIKQLQWQLYKKCCQQNKYLEGQAVRLFNNKIQNYQNLIMEFQKNYSRFLVQRVNKINQINLALPINKYQRQQQIKMLEKISFFQNKNAIQLIQAFKNRQKIEQTIKTFFQNLRIIYNDLQQNFRQTVQVVEKTQKELFDKFNDENSNSQKQRRRGFGMKQQKKKNQTISTITATYASNLFYDRNFLDILGSLARKDQKIMTRCKSIIAQQYEFFLQYQSKKFGLNEQINKICHTFKLKQQQRKKVQKLKNYMHQNTNQTYNGIIGQIQQIRLNLSFKLVNYQKYLIPSTLNVLLSQIVQRHLKIQQFVCAHQKKLNQTQFQVNQQELQEQNNHKFKEYQEYALKVQSHNFDDPIYQSFIRAVNFERIQSKKQKTEEDNSFFATQGYIQPEKHLESKNQSLKMLNKLLAVFFQQWSNSQFFHELIKQQLQISLNIKRPNVLQPLVLQYLKIQEKTKDSGFQNILPHETQVFRCLFDVKLNFKGKIAVHIKSKLNFGNRNPLHIKLLIKQFKCPLRICFTPYSIGKSYVSLLQRPFLNVEYDVTLNSWHINKIPFFTQIIKIFIVTKLRKKMLWPKRMTLSIPLAFKKPLAIAIRERTQFQNQKLKRKK